MASVEQVLPIVEAVVTHIDEGVIFADNNGEVLYHNPATLKLLSLDSVSQLRDIKRLGAINLHKALLKAAIDAGEVDAAGRPSGNFVRFEHVVESEDATRFLEFNSGLVEYCGIAPSIAVSRRFSVAAVAAASYQTIRRCWGSFHASSKSPRPMRLFFFRESREPARPSWPACCTK